MNAVTNFDISEYHDELDFLLKENEAQQQAQEEAKAQAQAHCEEEGLGAGKGGAPSPHSRATSCYSDKSSASSVKRRRGGRGQAVKRARDHAHPHAHADDGAAPKQLFRHASIDDFRIPHIGAPQDPGGSRPRQRLRRQRVFTPAMRGAGALPERAKMNAQEALRAFDNQAMPGNEGFPPFYM